MICVCVHIHTHIYIWYIHTHTHAETHIYVYIYMYMCICTPVYRAGSFLVLVGIPAGSLWEKLSHIVRPTIHERLVLRIYW